jgi:hypothetical protein
VSGARLAVLSGLVCVCSFLVTSRPLGASQDDWSCNLRVYVGEIGGAPADTSQYLGVRADASDQYEQADSKKPGTPQGDYIYSWFNRSGWGQGAILSDWRAPIEDATSKVWGTGTFDTWNVKLNFNAAEHSGYWHECDIFQDLEYPVASAVYLTWEIGVGESVPPEDYVFTLQYRGGINAKPTGTAPPGLTVPTMNTEWDMRTTPYIVIPLWSESFQPWLPDCSNFAAGDTARFKIIVANPEGEPLAGGGGMNGMSMPGLLGPDAPLLNGLELGGGEGGALLSTSADPETIVSPVLAGGCWHLISLPARPADSTPPEVFRDPDGMPININGNLHRWDPVAKGYVTYYSFAPESFGYCRTGDAYWLYLFEDTRISYQGYRNLCTQRLDLAAKSQANGRWFMVGTPFDRPVALADCLFEDQKTLVKNPPGDALMLDWISLPMVRYEPGVGYVNVGINGIDPEHDLRPWFGYWLDPPTPINMVVPNPDPGVERLTIGHPDAFYVGLDEANSSNVICDYSSAVVADPAQWPGGIMIDDPHFGVNQTYYGVYPDWPGYNYFNPGHAQTGLRADQPYYDLSFVTSNEFEGYLFIPTDGTWWFRTKTSTDEWAGPLCQGAFITIDDIPVLYGGWSPPEVLPPGMEPPWNWVDDAFPSWYSEYLLPSGGVHSASLELQRGLHAITIEHFAPYPGGSYGIGNAFQWTRDADPADQHWNPDPWLLYHPFYTCDTPDNPSEDMGIYTSKWYDLGECRLGPYAEICWTIPEGSGSVSVEYQYKASLEDSDPVEWEPCESNDLIGKPPQRYFRYRVTLYDPHPNDLVLDDLEVCWLPYPVTLKDFEVLHNPATVPPDRPYIVCDHAVTDPNDPEQPVIRYVLDDLGHDPFHGGVRAPYIIKVTVCSAHEGGPQTSRYLDGRNPEGWDPEVDPDPTVPGTKQHLWWDLWFGSPPQEPGIFWYNVEVWDQCFNRDHRLSEYLDVAEHRVEFSHWDEGTDTAHMCALDTLTDSSQPEPLPASQAYIDVWAEDFAPVALGVASPTTTIAPPGVPNENPNVTEISFDGDADDSRYVLVTTDGHATYDTYAQGDNSPVRVRPAQVVNDFRIKAYNAWTITEEAGRTSLYKGGMVWLLEEAANYRVRPAKNPSTENVRLELHKGDWGQYDAAVFLAEFDGPDGATDPGHGQVYTTCNTKHLIIATPKNVWNADPRLTTFYAGYHWSFLDDWGPRQWGGKWADCTHLAVISACGLADNQGQSSFIARRHHQDLGIDCVIWLHPEPNKGYTIDRDASGDWIRTFAQKVLKSNPAAALTAQQAMKETNLRYARPRHAAPWQCPVGDMYGRCSECKVSPAQFGVLGW